MTLLDFDTPDPTGRYIPAPILEAENDPHGEERDRAGLGRALVETSATEWDPLPHQLEALRFVLDPDRPMHRTLALLGSYGGGKTRGAAQCFFAACAAEPWREDYGHNRPTSAVVASTFRTLRQSSLVQLESVIPRQAIAKRLGPPENRIDLSNGHRIVFISGEGELEGQSFANVWVDEIGAATFTRPRIANIVARIRDPLAKSLNFIVSGLATYGTVSDLFNRPNTPKRKTILCAMTDNRHISSETREALMSAIPDGADYMLQAVWQSAPGAVYPGFNPAVHIAPIEWDRRKEIHLSFDVGSQGAVLLGQPTQVSVRNITGQKATETGLVILEELLPENQSVDEVCYRLKTDPKTADMLAAGVGSICIDATADRDELGALRRHFPKAPIIKRDRGDPLYHISTGVRLTSRALKDSLGNTRLFFSPRLRGNKRGVIDSIPKLRYRENSEDIIRDNATDHVTDALRYMVCHLLPETRPATMHVTYGR